MASAIYAEFKALLIRELEKVDYRFFDIHDNCQEQVEELDATVFQSHGRSNGSGIMVLQRKRKTNGKKHTVYANYEGEANV